MIFFIVEDLAKLQNLSNLQTLIVNQNPLGMIPSFNISTLRSISFEDCALTSAAFPASFQISAVLQTIGMNKNRLGVINQNDFAALKNARVRKLTLDNTNLYKIDSSAFAPLKQLQSVSFIGNQLQTLEFLPTLPVLASIKLDDNQFSALPPEMSQPQKIQSFSFLHNKISVIDDSSPLNRWEKMNSTSAKVTLANNTFDCCKSIWFIKFLKRSSKFVPDASQLMCQFPTELIGKKLMDVDENTIKCDDNKSKDKTVWISIGGSACGVATIAVVSLAIFFRKKKRSQYIEIPGVDSESYPDVNFPSTAPTDYTNSDIESVMSDSKTLTSFDPPDQDHSTVTGVSARDQES